MKNDASVKHEAPIIRPLENSLPIQLLKVHDHVMAYFRPMLNRFGMTDQQWRVLRAIAADVTDFADLAKATHIQPASLSRMLITLQENGWTSRTVSTSDRRQRTVRMTEKGWALFHAASAETERLHATLETDLGDVYADLMHQLGASAARFEASTDSPDEDEHPKG